MTRSILFSWNLIVLCSVASSAFMVRQIPSSMPRRNMALLHMSSSSSPSLEGGNTDGENRRRMAEFLNLEPLLESPVRKERRERDSQSRAQFATYGDDLWELRTTQNRLRADLNATTTAAAGTTTGMTFGMRHSQQLLQEQLRLAEKRDPEIVYRVELEHYIHAEREGRMEQAAHHKAAALAARSCLPQFNLEGLWVGKYGGHGYEMINVTYAGDTLVAFKVTGDKNVPRGEISFQADLSPLRQVPLKQQQHPLQPIVLTDKAAKKWGTKQLPRYNGLGQVAEEGFQNHQWMDGQLILIGKDYFSFAWVPIEHQIFFGRPSPELALKMLRNGGVASLKGKASWNVPPSVNDDLELLKDYVAHCLEVTTETIEEELKGDEFGCIWHGMDTEECYFE